MGLRVFVGGGVGVWGCVGGAFVKALFVHAHTHQRLLVVGEPATRTAPSHTTPRVGSYQPQLTILLPLLLLLLLPNNHCCCCLTITAAVDAQMYALLALVVALCPSVQSGLDEHVLAALKDKYGEKLQVCCCLATLVFWGKCFLLGKAAGGEGGLRVFVCVALFVGQGGLGGKGGCVSLCVLWACTCGSQGLCVCQCDHVGMHKSVYV